MPEILVTFKNSLSQLRSSPMKLLALRGGGKEDLKKVCTVAMGYVTLATEMIISHHISRISAREIQFRHF